MNLTQRQLRMFVSTATLRNVSRASEALHISQPALTRALQEFESQLGVTLLRRTTRHISLTHEGERFLPVAQRLLRELEQAAVDVREQTHGASGSVVLAVGTAFGTTVLPGVLRRFAAHFPGVRIKLVDDNSAGITSRVSRGEVDLGIASPVGHTGELHCELLLTAPLGLLADPHRYPLPTALPAKALANLHLLKESSDTSIMDVLRSHGSELVALKDRGIEVSSLALQLALAQEGVGVAVVSALGASHPMARGLHFVPLKPTVQRELFLIERRDCPPSPCARALVHAIRAGLPTARLHAAVRIASAAAKGD